MIFVTVGAQMGFDRLIRAVDEWSEAHPDAAVFAQIGPGEYVPQHIEWTRFLEPAEFRERIESATAIVGHAGMGTIITALQHGKPVLIMPRKGELQETRNDHQIATAERFGSKAGIEVAMDESVIAEKLDTISAIGNPERVGSDASERLIKTIHTFIHAG